MQPGTTLPLDCNVTLKWSDGRISIFHASFVHEFSQWVHMTGPKGRISYNDLCLPTDMERTSFTVTTDSGPREKHRIIRGNYDKRVSLHFGKTKVIGLF